MTYVYQKRIYNGGVTDSPTIVKVEYVLSSLTNLIKVVDMWVDRAEPMFRYAELDVTGKRVLLPMTMARVSRSGELNVRSIRSDQFQQVPTLANPDQVTLQEEDRITAFYGGGTLYAMPNRQEPSL